jgi:hypothetical protein
VARSTRGGASHDLYQKFTAFGRARRPHCATEGGNWAAGRSRCALWAVHGSPLLRAATPGCSAPPLSQRRRREAGGRHFGSGREARAGSAVGQTERPFDKGSRVRGVRHGRRRRRFRARRCSRARRRRVPSWSCASTEPRRLPGWHLLSGCLSMDAVITHSITPSPLPWNLPGRGRAAEGVA